MTGRRGAGAPAAAEGFGLSDLGPAGRAGIWSRAAAERAVAWRRRAAAELRAAECDVVRAVDPAAARAASIVVDHVAADHRAAAARVAELAAAGVAEVRAS